LRTELHKIPKSNCALYGACATRSGHAGCCVHRISCSCTNSSLPSPSTSRRIRNCLYTSCHGPNTRTRSARQTASKQHAITTGQCGALHPLLPSPACSSTDGGATAPSPPAHCHLTPRLPRQRPPRPTHSRAAARVPSDAGMRAGAETASAHVRVSSRCVNLMGDGGTCDGGW
jgi:hypothetical protein